MPKRIRMSLRLSDENKEFPVKLVPADEKHLHAIAEAVLDAYQDTIDYEGENLEQTLEELKRVYKGSYGPPIAKPSLLVMDNGIVKAGVLICLFQGEPTITYTFTRKQDQRLGYATLLICNAAYELYKMGYHSLFLYVTVENKGAVRLYESLGFKEVPLSTVTEINID